MKQGTRNKKLGSPNSEVRGAIVRPRVIPNSKVRGAIVRPRVIPTWNLRFLVPCFLFMIVAATAHAQAEPDGPPPLFGEAVRAFEEGRYADAAEMFSNLAELQPAAPIYCNLGTTYERWGDHLREAIAAFERCAELDTEDRFRHHALERAEALRAQLPGDEPGEVGNPFVDAPNPDNPNVVDVQHHAQPDPQSARAPERGHALLGVGIVIAAVGGGLIAAGAVLASGSRDDEAWLDERFPGDDPVTLAQGSEEARRFNRAKQRRNTAIGLYVGSTVLLATGVIMAIIDLAGGLATPVYVAPERAGATVGVQGRF